MVRNSTMGDGGPNHQEYEKGSATAKLDETKEEKKEEEKEKDQSE